MEINEELSKEIEETENRIIRYYVLPEGFIDKFRKKFYQKMLEHYETKTNNKSFLQELIQRSYFQALIFLEQICPERK